MQPAIIAALSALGVALAGAASGYLLARRRESGRVVTSDAQTVFTAAAGLIDDMQGELARVHGRATELERALDDVRRRQRADEAACTEQIRALQARIGQLEQLPPQPPRDF